jgi:hypothetical protein
MALRIRWKCTYLLELAVEEIFLTSFGMTTKMALQENAKLSENSASSKTTGTM